MVLGLGFRVQGLGFRAREGVCVGYQVEKRSHLRSCLMSEACCESTRGCCAFVLRGLALKWFGLRTAGLGV